MSERFIVRIKFTPAGNAGEVRRAVGGFLRYVQHRDLHPDSKPRATSEVAGLLKYVAYRDRANMGAELFGPTGAIGSKERKAFAEFVACSLENSKPQPFHTKDGRVIDRRRAVSRLIISPERALGLDLNALTRAAVGRLESELGVDGLRWIAAIHRNTEHHHVHLVVAGMVEDGEGGYRRADVTKARLAAMKEAVALEIDRQRGERQPSPRMHPPPSGAAGSVADSPTLEALVARPAAVQTLQLQPLARVRMASSGAPAATDRRWHRASSLLRLRAVARRYSRQMQRELQREARLRDWERAA